MKKNPESRKHPKSKRRMSKSHVSGSRHVGQSDMLRKSYERNQIDESGAEIER
jgi:hypothetical protein